jgi:hypothetical protein
MGIMLFGLERLLAPLQTLVHWMPGAAPLRGINSWARAPAVHPGALRSCPPRAGVPGHGADKPRRALRVVRVLEASPAPSHAGRMIISGRMADVCAELDRLAALESAAS